MKISALPLVLILLFLAGCDTGATYRAAILISVSPSSAQLTGGESQQFTATVLYTANTAVTWAVEGGGTISSSGMYTAPATVTSQAVVTVTATSQADPARSAAGAVTLMPAVTVNPSGVQVGVTGTQQFTAEVMGTSDTRVTWSLSGAGCSGATCGSITAAGLYTAPCVFLHRVR